MKTYKINEKEIKIAETAKDIKLTEMVKFINDSKNVEPNSIQFKLLLTVLLTDLTEDEVDNLEFNDLKNLLTNISDEILMFNNSFVTSITINDVTYTSNIIDGKFILKIKDSKLIESLVKKYGLNYVYYLSSFVFRKDWSIPVTLEEIEANKDIFKDITADIIGPYLIKISDIINEKGI